MQRLRIKAASAKRFASFQEAINKGIARALALQNPKFLILDEPTRGIDIGAKGEIQSLINELAEGGLGVLMISSELEELVEGCSRVIVMRDGQRVAELRGSEISQQSIIHAMAEGSANDASIIETTPAMQTGAPQGSGD
jgi:ribose transport system ATP-binding protein